jgi:hypothetical protein
MHFSCVKSKWGFIELTISGLVQATNKGIGSILDVCCETLQVLLMNLND